MNQSEDEQNEDWEIDASGLWIATRSFLIRRGYCCANQCRHCPYINWRNTLTWQPSPAEAVQFAEVSPKVLKGIHQKLAYHQQQLQVDNAAQKARHRSLIFVKGLTRANGTRSGRISIAIGARSGLTIGLNRPVGCSAIWCSVPGLKVFFSIHASLSLNGHQPCTLPERV